MNKNEMDVIWEDSKEDSASQSQGNNNKQEYIIESFPNSKSNSFYIKSNHQSNEEKIYTNKKSNSLFLLSDFSDQDETVKLFKPKKNILKLKSLVCKGLPQKKPFELLKKTYQIALPYKDVVFNSCKIQKRRKICNKSKIFQIF